MTASDLLEVYRAQLCPVCGFALGFEPWSGDSAADEICPSCGIQFGCDDSAAGILSDRLCIYSDWRQRWIDGGMAWWSQRERPQNWNPTEQLERLQDAKT
jgi:hypothetical protein